MYPQRPLADEHSIGPDFLLNDDQQDEAAIPSAEVAANPGIPNISGGVVFDECLQPYSNVGGQPSNQQPMIENDFDSTSIMLPVMTMALSLTSQTVTSVQQMGGDPGNRSFTNGGHHFHNQQANGSHFTIGMDSIGHGDLNTLSNRNWNPFGFNANQTDLMQSVPTLTMSNVALPQSTYDGNDSQAVGGNNCTPPSLRGTAPLPSHPGYLDNIEQSFDINALVAMLEEGDLNPSNPSPVDTTSQSTHQMLPNVGVSTETGRGITVVNFNAQDCGGFAASRMPEEVTDMSLNTGVTQDCGGFAASRMPEEVTDMSLNTGVTHVYNVQNTQQMHPSVAPSFQGDNIPSLLTPEDLQSLGVQTHYKATFPQTELEAKREKNKLSARRSRERKRVKYEQALKELKETKQLNNKLKKRKERYEAHLTRTRSYLASVQKPATPMEENAGLDMVVPMEVSYPQEPPPTPPLETGAVSTNNNNFQSNEYSAWSVGRDDDSEDDDLVEFFKNKKHD